MAYIYKITNNINGKVYIGETTRTVQIRWNQHKTRVRNTQFTEYLYNAMRKYGIENFSVEQIRECPDEERFKIETEYITKFRSYVGFDDCNGYNLVLSQNGPAPILKQEVSNFWNDGFTVVQISERLHIDIKTVRHILRSVGVTEEMTLARRAEYAGRHSRKPVNQYSLEGELLNTFESASAAARYIGKGHGSICSSCTGRLLTAYNYIWQYVDDDNIEEIVLIVASKSKVGSNKKRVQKIDLEGNIIEEFESASAAGRSLNKSHAGIAYAARNNKTAYGYYWKYI